MLAKRELAPLSPCQARDVESRREPEKQLDVICHHAACQHLCPVTPRLGKQEAFEESTFGVVDHRMTIQSGPRHME